MSCKERDDMDLVVQLKKIDNFGNPLAGVNFPCRASETSVPEAETSKLFGSRDSFEHPRLSLVKRHDQAMGCTWNYCSAEYYSMAGGHSVRSGGRAHASNWRPVFKRSCE